VSRRKIEEKLHEEKLHECIQGGNRKNACEEGYLELISHDPVMTR